MSRRRTKSTTARSVWSRPSRSSTTTAAFTNTSSNAILETSPIGAIENPVVNAAIENRIAYLQSKADSLYALTSTSSFCSKAPGPKSISARAI